MLVTLAGEATARPNLVVTNLVVAAVVVGLYWLFQRWLRRRVSERRRARWAEEDQQHGTPADASPDGDHRASRDAGDGDAPPRV